MSFIKREESTGKAYAPGYFLAHEECTRKTYQFKADDASVVTAENGGKYIPMGTVIKGDDGSIEGIAYEDVDVTYGDMPGSLVTKGDIYADRLNGEADASALALAGFNVFDEAPTAERPSDFDIPSDEEDEETDAETESSASTGD